MIVWGFSPLSILKSKGQAGRPVLRQEPLQPVQHLPLALCLP